MRSRLEGAERCARLLLNVEDNTHHVHDLLQGQAELQDHGVRLVGHGTLQGLVLGHQVIDESPLVGAAEDDWEYYWSLSGPLAG